MHLNEMVRCIIAILSMLGAFFGCAIAAAFGAQFIGLWPLPVSGSCAAFGVVSVAYIAAPSHRLTTAVLVYLLGVAIAWVVLEPSAYPDTYVGREYQPTHLPFIVTCMGGTLSLALLPVLRRKRSNDA